MKTKLSLIKIVKRPINKNCWLSVEGSPELRPKYGDYIEDYDFIDFEGEVFYYDVLDSLTDCFIDSFIYTKNMVISDSTLVIGLGEFMKNEFKDSFSKRFMGIEGELKIDIISE